jgi:hypothetical protein
MTILDPDDLRAAAEVALRMARRPSPVALGALEKLDSSSEAMLAHYCAVVGVPEEARGYYVPTDRGDGVMVALWNPV